MRTGVALPLLLSALAPLACKTGDRGAPADTPGAGTASGAVSAAPTLAAAPAPSAAPAGSSAATAATRTGNGRLPFEYPPTATTARVGDVVLAPPRQWIDNAIKEGLDKQPFVYFRAQVLEPGQAGTLVKTPSGRQEEIPNALVIPIRRGAKAKVGQVVLTAWHQGTGLQRAMVLKGGKPTSPRVHYLDLRYQHPSELGKGADTLPPNSFHPLEKPGEVGTSVACRDGERHRHYILVHVGPQQMLGLGFAGRLRVLDPAECQLLDIKPAIDDGPLFVPVMGVFQKVRVRHYEEEVGRVFVHYNAGGEDQDDVLGVVNVTRGLSSSD